MKISNIDPLEVMGWFLIALIIIIFGVACYKINEHKTVTLAVETREFIILDVDPPKHVYVKVQDVLDGTIYKVFVSKHCNRWQEIRIGSKVSLPRYTKEYINFKPKKQVWTIGDAYDICPRH